MRKMRWTALLLAAFLLLGGAGAQADGSKTIVLSTQPPETTLAPLMEVDPAWMEETGDTENAAEPAVNPDAQPVGEPTATPLPSFDELEYDLQEGVYSLPIDFSGGKKLSPFNLLNEWEYEDPSIHVRVSMGVESRCYYWIADIIIADASQLRTIAAAGDISEVFKAEMNMDGARLAKRVNAVVAVDGDFWFYNHGRGFILRQGTVYINQMRGTNKDVLLIDEDGDFHIVRKAKEDTVAVEIDGKKVINAFFFGPVLYENGSIRGKLDAYVQEGATYNSQRIALCQVGHLHYKIICVAGVNENRKGMKLKDFATFVGQQGVEVAYNLDGGNSSFLYFYDRQINAMYYSDPRQLADIIYFASAYDGAQ